MTMPSMLVSTIIIILGGSMLLWWVTRRVRWGWLRALLRLIALPALIVLMGFLSVVMARSQTTGVPQRTPLIVPIESMTVAPGTLTQTLNSTGALIPADQTILSFGVSAPVTDVLVSVGDFVHAGDVLARADTTNIDSQIRSAQLNVQQAQNSLDALNAPASDIDVAIAKLGITSAQAGLSSASETGSSDTDIQIANLQQELAKNQLWQSQLNRDMNNEHSNPNAPNAQANAIEQSSSMTQSEMNVQIQEVNTNGVVNREPNQGQLVSASAQLVSAQASLDALLSGPSDADVRQAQIAVDTAQLALDTVEKQRDKAEIVAPFDGVVASVDIAVGGLPSSTGAITLIDTSGYTITLSVDEKDISTLAVGQQVRLSVQAVSGAEITGTVTRIDPSPTLDGQLVNYNVEVTLNPGETPLRPGMSAVATVILSELNGVLVVPNRFITTDPTTQQTTVKVQTALGTYTDVPVTLGERTDSESQIVSGVTAGQTLVILSNGTTAAQGGFGLFGARPAGGGGFQGGGNGGGGFQGGGNGGGFNRGGG